MSHELTTGDVILLSALGAAWVLAGLLLLVLTAAAIYALVHRICTWREQVLEAAARRRDLRTCQAINALPTSEGPRR
jgi:Na+-transporting methylmalonyl-CoA/oxaloacetate decarboxylase gamma subunit